MRQWVGSDHFIKSNYVEERARAFNFFGGGTKNGLKPDAVPLDLDFRGYIVGDADRPAHELIAVINGTKTH